MTTRRTRNVVDQLLINQCHAIGYMAYGTLALGFLAPIITIGVLSTRPRASRSA